MRCLMRERAHKSLTLIVSAAICLVAPIAAQPPNDSCTNGTIVPGNIVTYDPALLNTTTALTELCGAPESCEVGGVGTSKSVWYTYTPDQDGTVDINTFGGSDYDTVLSVHDGCGRFIGIGNCDLPNELACNDNALFGTLSQVFLGVTGGETYHIKVADHGFMSAGGQLDFNMRYIAPNDLCANATVVDSANYDPPLLSIHHAQSEPCEAQESCELNNVGVSNAVWYSISSLQSGYLSIDTNGSTYDTVLSVWDGCREFLGPDNCGPIPTEIACDDDAGLGTQSELIDVPIQGGQTLLIKVANYNTSQGEGFLDFNLVFSETPMNPNIFADGFESGDTSVWSASSP